MKTCALYGFICALIGAFVTLVLYFLGFHSEASKLSTATTVGGTVGLAAVVACTALGVKARRNEVPSTSDFGYGSALWAGTVINFVGSLLSSVFSYAYYAFINPGFSELIIQDRMAKLEASGVSGDRLEKAESMTRAMMAPGWASLIAFIYIFIIGVVVSLVVAAIFKRSQPDAPTVM
jgi:hypothetical protein